MKVDNNCTWCTASEVGDFVIGLFRRWPCRSGSRGDLPYLRLAFSWAPGFPFSVIDSMSLAFTRGCVKFLLTKTWPGFKFTYTQLRCSRLHLEHVGREASHYHQLSEI